MNTLRNCCLLLSCLFSFNSIDATHLMGGDITYKIIDTATGEYKVTLSLYRDCAGILYSGASLFYQVGASSGNKTMSLVSTEEVTSICYPPDRIDTPTTNCPSGQVGTNGIKGIMKNVYEVNIVLGKNKGYAIVAWSSCCRNQLISTCVNPGGQSMWIQAFINTNYSNSSPVFTAPPVPYWCRQRVNEYNHGAIDTVDTELISINGKSANP